LVLIRMRSDDEIEEVVEAELLDSEN